MSSGRSSHDLGEVLGPRVRAVRRSCACQRANPARNVLSLEPLERRRLLSGGAVSITIGQGETYQLTGDITDFTSLTIQGAGPNSVLEGNGFQIVNNSLAGNVTISNVRLHNLGQPWIDPSTATLVFSPTKYAINLTTADPSSTSVITIQNTIFDASSSVFVWNGPGSTTNVTGVTVLQNSLAPGGVTPDASASFFTGRGPSTLPKLFQDNQIYESFIDFDAVADWLISDNIIAGDRGGILVSRSSGVEIADNYIHTLHDFAATHPENPFGSQISSLSLDTNSNTRTHDNILRDSGFSSVRGLTGEFDHNLVLDLQAGSWIVSPAPGTAIHDNIFAPKYDGQTLTLLGGIRLIDPASTGVEVYNNTFDGGPGFNAPAINLGPGVTLAALHNNIFYDFPVNLSVGSAIVRPADTETVSGSPPRPATDPDRMTFANDNDYYNPNAAPGTVDYAVGVDGATNGSDNFGSRDLSGIDPGFASPPPTSFPFSDDDIKSGVVTVQQILDFYRDAYSLGPGSPLTDRNIGAVPRVSGPPISKLQPVSVTLESPTASFDIAFTGDAPLNPDTINAQGVTVTGSNGFSAPAMLVGVTGSGQKITAHYTITGPGGLFDVPDNGTYTVSLDSPQVADTIGRTVTAGPVGTFNVHIIPDTTPPSVSLTSYQSVTDLNVSQVTIMLTISDPAGVDLDSVQNGQFVTISGPSLSAAPARLVGVDASADGKQVMATYAIDAPAGSFHQADNGTYQIALTGGAIRDLKGNFVADRPSVGSFTVNVNDHAGSLVVQIGGKIPASAIGGVTKASLKLNLVNQGGGGVQGNSSVSLYLSADTVQDASDILIATMPSPALNLTPGKGKSLSANVVIPAPPADGDYHVLAVLDRRGVGQAANYAAASQTIHVADPYYNLSGVAKPAVAKAGKPASLSLTLTNNGNTAIKNLPTPLRVLLSTDGQFDGNGELTLLDTVSPLSIAPGKSKTLRLKLPPVTIGPGTFAVEALIDPDGRTADANRSDNTIAGTITVA